VCSSDLVGRCVISKANGRKVADLLAPLTGDPASPAEPLAA